MTKADYEVLATALRNSDLSKDEITRVSKILARALENQSGRFNYGRFVIACDPASEFTYTGKR